MDQYDVFRLVQTIHVLAAFAVAGGIAIETVIGPLMARSGTVQELRAYTRVGAIAENFLIGPGFILLIIFGFATADRGEIDFDTPWLTTAMVLVALQVVISLAFLRTSMMRADRAARAAADGALSEDLRAMVKNPLPAVMGSLFLLLFVATVVLMVVQPDW